MPSLTRLAFPLACIALAAPARAERWTLSAGAGASLGYQAHSGARVSTDFDPSWIVTGDVTRVLGERWTLHATAGDLHFSKDWPLTSIPEVDATHERSVDFVPAGIGVRFFPAPGRSRTVQAYLEATPTLYVSRWRAHETWEDFSTTPARSGSSTATTTRLLAGFAVGAGYQWRTGPHLRPELAVRYHFSARPGQVEAWDFAPLGVSTVTIATSLGWAL